MEVASGDAVERQNQEEPAKVAAAKEQKQGRDEHKEHAAGDPSVLLADALGDGDPERQGDEVRPVVAQQYGLGLRFRLHHISGEQHEGRRPPSRAQGLQQKAEE